MPGPLIYLFTQHVGLVCDSVPQTPCKTGNPPLRGFPAREGKKCLCVGLHGVALMLSLWLQVPQFSLSCRALVPDLQLMTRFVTANLPESNSGHRRRHSGVCVLICVKKQCFSIKEKRPCAKRSSNQELSPDKLSE